MKPAPIWISALRVGLGLGDYRVAEDAYTIDLDFDGVAGMEVARLARCAGHYDVARFQCDHPGDELDDGRHVVEKV